MDIISEELIHEDAEDAFYHVKAREGIFIHWINKRTGEDSYFSREEVIRARQVSTAGRA